MMQKDHGMHYRIIYDYLIVEHENILQYKNLWVRKSHLTCLLFTVYTPKKLSNF